MNWDEFDQLKKGDRVYQRSGLRRGRCGTVVGGKETRRVLWDGTRSPKTISFPSELGLADEHLLASVAPEDLP